MPTVPRRWTHPAFGGTFVPTKKKQGFSMLQFGTWRAAFSAALLGMTLVVLPAAAQEAKGGKAEAAEKPAPPAKSFRADRVGTFNGTRVNYTMLAGETRLRNDKDEEVASIFSTAYLKAGARAAERPVTFLFNGGPGSSSLWLHMGVFGPRRLDVPDAANAGGAPYPIIENEQSILDVTDLVFIDPVGTGYSRVVGKGEEKDYFGVEEDGKAVAAFIRQWLSDNKRWNSPKYLGGESYGGVRAGAVAKELSSAANWVSLNGIIIVSGAIDLDALSFAPGSDSSYWSFLPSYAATAWHYDLVKDKSKGFDAFLAEVRDFALSEYAPALLKGARLTAEERQTVAAKLAAYTGISQSYIERANLRISGGRFQKELLRERGVTVGRFDTRYQGRDYDDAGETPDDDPSFFTIAGAYTASINQYFAELGIDMGREYKILTGIGRQWNWKISGGGRQTGLTVAPWIGEAMRQNDALRTFVACGYHDLATPFFAVENAFNGPGVPVERVEFAYYEGGHMMYLYPPSMTKLTQDVRAFIQKGSIPG